MDKAQRLAVVGLGIFLRELGSDGVEVFGGLLGVTPGFSRPMTVTATEVRLWR